MIVLFNFVRRAQTTCTQGAVRLVGGPNSREGRVEICNNNEWGTVCNNMWSTNDAVVVCKELGFPAVGKSDYQTLVLQLHIQSL